MDAADVLVVEDAPEFARMLTELLCAAGHRPRVATTGAAALAALAAADPDLVLLDLTLPDVDGLDVCRAIRDRSTTRILVVSGRFDDVNRLVSAALGADGYVTKPFSPAALLQQVAELLAAPRRP